MEYASNGRVSIVENERIELYPMSKGHDKKGDFNEEAIKGIHSNNMLSQIFFSQINIDGLQEAIRYQVYVKSCKQHVIARQSETELKIIMRAMYLENARHRQNDILPEIRRLNALVLDFCVPRILQEIKMYISYRNDINKLPTPLDRGEFQSSKGTKYLEQKSW